MSYRCVRRIFVADWLSGYVNKGQEDVNDPYTYAWDVLAHPRYCGLRVEVKTHQTDSRWISVTTGCSGEYPYGSGINLGPILNHQVADCIIIFNTKEIHPGVIQYTPKFIGDREDLRKVVRKATTTDGIFPFKKISQNGLHTTRTVVLYNYQLRRSKNEI